MYNYIIQTPNPIDLLNIIGENEKNNFYTIVEIFDVPKKKKKNKSKKKKKN